MQINPQPLGSVATASGVKAVIYGPPGSGKTPMLATLPAGTVVCITEPGTLSLRGMNTEVVGVECYDRDSIEAFFNWVQNDPVGKQYHTICVDSVSQMAELYLDYWLLGPNKKKDGRAAYGKMSEEMMRHLNYLFFVRNRNCVLLAKQGYVEQGGVKKRCPFFPGQDLNVKVPHLFDQILHLDTHNVPGQGAVSALHCKPSYDSLGRDRSGKLAEYEPSNLSSIFNKILS
jgi:hypothetical protein